MVAVADYNQRINALRSALASEVTPADFLAAEDAVSMVGRPGSQRWAPWAFTLLSVVVLGAVVGPIGLSRLGAGAYMVAVGVMRLGSSPAIVDARRRFDAGRTAVAVDQADDIAADFAVVAATHPPLARRLALAAIAAGIAAAALLSPTMLALLALGRAAVLAHTCVTAQALRRVAFDVVAAAEAQPWHASIVAARDRADAQLRELVTRAG